MSSSEKLTMVAKATPLMSFVKSLHTSVGSGSDSFDFYMVFNALMRTDACNVHSQFTVTKREHQDLAAADSTQHGPAVLPPLDSPPSQLRVLIAPLETVQSRLVALSPPPACSFAQPPKCNPRRKTTARTRRWRDEKTWVRMSSRTSQ